MRSGGGAGSCERASVFDVARRGADADIAADLDAAAAGHGEAALAADLTNARLVIRFRLGRARRQLGRVGADAGREHREQGEARAQSFIASFNSRSRSSFSCASRLLSSEASARSSSAFLISWSRRIALTSSAGIAVSASRMQPPALTSTKPPRTK